MPTGERQPTGERGPNVVSLSAELLRAGRVLPTVAQIAMLGEDFLTTIVQSVRPGNVGVRGRFLDGASGQVLPFNYVFPFVGGTALNAFVPPGIGYLLGATFRAVMEPSANTVAPPFVTVSIYRGGGVLNSQELQGLVSAYSTQAYSVTWPYTNWQSPRDGPGYPRAITGTTPAAGAEVSETIPIATVARMTSVRFVLTTSAAAGNRSVRVIIQTGSPIAFLTVLEAAAVHPPSTTRGYNFYVGATLSIPVVDQLMIPWPIDLWMSTGDKFTSNTVAFDAADQYSNIRYQFQDYREVV